MQVITPASFMETNPAAAPTILSCKLMASIMIGDVYIDN